ncbi:hypothetical protein P5V15_010523 [Pogonomyrmex californicus]
MKEKLAHDYSRGEDVAFSALSQRHPPIIRDDAPVFDNNSSSLASTGHVTLYTLTWPLPYIRSHERFTGRKQGRKKSGRRGQQKKKKKKKKKMKKRLKKRKERRKVHEGRRAAEKGEGDRGQGGLPAPPAGAAAAEAATATATAATGGGRRGERSWVMEGGGLKAQEKRRNGKE